MERLRSTPMLFLLVAVPALAAPPGRADVAAGKAVYARDCAGCHGATGKGDGDDAMYFTTKPRDLSAPGALDKRTDDFLAAVITQGGAAKGLSKDMPAAKLTPGETRDVIAYVRQLGAKPK